MSNRIAASVAFLFAFLLSCIAPSFASNSISSFPVPTAMPSNGRAGTNAVNFAYQQNPSEAQFLGMQRNQRLGDGAFWFQYFGAQPHYANLAVTPSGGLFVQVAPAVSGTIGSVYAIQPDDSNIFGTGANALPADPTIIGVQGNLTTPPIGVGPLTPPNSAGQSVSYLIECTVVRQDQNPFQYNFINNSNQVTQQTIFHDRNDVVTCQQKASTSAVTPVTPTADSGYVAVASVVVPYGTTTISGGITMQTAGAVGLPLQSLGGATINGAGCFVTSNSNVCPTGITSGGGITDTSGVLVSPVNVNVSLCPSSNCTLTATTAGVAVQGVINATGSITSNGNVSAASAAFGGLSSTYGIFGAGSYTANAQQLTVGNDGSNSYLRSGSGGIYLQNGPGSSTLASFTGSGETVYGNIGATGNVSGVQGVFSSGLSGSTGSFSNLVTSNVGFTTGASNINPGGISSGGNVYSASGTFTSPSGSIYLCTNSVSGACPLYANAYGLHYDGSGASGGLAQFTLGQYGHDANGTGGFLSFGNATAGSTQIGAQAAGRAIGAVNGSMMYVAECTSTTSACNVSNSVDMALDTNGNMAVAGHSYSTGALTQSARALKRDIHSVTDDPLSVIASVKPVWFNYKTEKKGAPQHLGLIADDTHSDISGPKHDHLDVNALEVMDAAAINELAQRKNVAAGANLQPQIDALQRELNYTIAALVILAFLTALSFVFLLRRKV